MVYDVAIAGAGCVGAMIARELSKYELSVCILEKENDVSCGASKANSGIIHGGFDPKPGTLKAKLNSEGVELLFEAAKQLGVPAKRCGSLVCARGKEQEPEIQALYERGIENGIEKMKIISGDEARALEPKLSGEVTLALFVPTAGIVSPYELTIAAVGNAMDNGVSLYRNFEVCDITAEENFIISSKNDERIEAKYFINAAGVFAGNIARMIGDESFEIIPRKGEYMLLDKSANTVSSTIFGVPDENGKGILISPTTHGNTILGPTAVESLPEDVSTTEEGLSAVGRGAKQHIPDISLREVITSFSGVRASTKGGDFIIGKSEKNSRFINVAAIDSPGLSSCVAIAKYVLDILKTTDICFKNKENWTAFRKNPCDFKDLLKEEKNEIIAKDPAYGRIICRCEGVSEGEIRAVIRQNPRPYDVDGVKRRARSGFGRCQGGFCLPSVMKILAQETNQDEPDVTKSGRGSEFLKGRI